jgi:hypothetical protein
VSGSDVSDASASSALRSIRTWLLAVALLLFAGQLLLAYALAQQSKENCQTVEKALDAYTEGLVSATQRPRTPEEQEKMDEAIVRLNQTYQPFFEKCG